MFNPLESARHIIAESDLTDPDEIAQQIFDRTPSKSVRDAYRLILRSVAREAIHQANMAASKPASSVPARSSRVAAIRDTHISYFAQRVFANGAWKMLGDCTRADVLDLAAQRQAIADRNAAKAAEFNALHDRMVSAGVELAGQLEKEAAA